MEILNHKLGRRAVLTMLVGGAGGAVLIGGYVVGGHIPIEIIDRLLAEKPKIVGITLPGMPEGTPGMPGNTPGPLDIYEIGGNPPKIYATI